MTFASTVGSRIVGVSVWLNKGVQVIKLNDLSWLTLAIRSCTVV